MRSRRVFLLTLIPLLCVGLASDFAVAQRGPAGRGGRGAIGRGRGAPQVPAEDRGIRVNTDRAFEGYTLFAPLTSSTTYLIDMQGRVVRTWSSDLAPGASVYIKDNGNILRGGKAPETAGFNGGGQGGRIQEFTFDGDLVWDYSLNDETHLTHHDIELLPNGNLLAITWELKTPEEARQAGRREEMISERGLWPDMLVEIEPAPPSGGRIVWEWHSFDHMIQNMDPNLGNYGDPADHPERIDINGDDASANPTPNPPTDLLHNNGVDYNAELDQIILSFPNFDEVVVIDHSTTTAEAAGSTGGRYGKGGDLLYRWGNPGKYGHGTTEDQRLGFQHDARWVPRGYPGEGHITIFSNRTPGPDGTTFTQVYEIQPPVDRNGRYTRAEGAPFGPAEPVWTYSAPDTFDATYISGADRLPNGNTLVSSGPQGRLFEVDPAGQIVWEYWSPYSGEFLEGNGAANPFSIFRAIRVPRAHPALAGRSLEPLDPQPAIAP